MNKMIKGAVAGTAGIALLAGGFSTYAVWTAEDKVNAGTITTGELSVDAGTHTWTDLAPLNVSDTTWDPATDLMVPGDELRLTQPIDITATGKNLKGVRVTFTGWQVSDNLASADFTISGTYAERDLRPLAGTPDTVFADFTPADFARIADADAVLNFAMKAEGTQQSMNASVNLSSVTVQVTQLTN